MVEYLKLLLTTGVVIGILDGLWLGFVAKKFYYTYLGKLLLSHFLFAPALLFYLLYIIGVVYFVVKPGILSGTLLSVIINGALFGIIAYATYDLTNLATLKNWAWQIAALDIFWGAFLTAAASGICFYFFHH